MDGAWTARLLSLLSTDPRAVELAAYVGDPTARGLARSEDGRAWASLEPVDDVFWEEPLGTWAEGLSSWGVPVCLTAARAAVRHVLRRRGLPHPGEPLDVGGVRQLRALLDAENDLQFSLSSLEEALGGDADRMTPFHCRQAVESAAFAILMDLHEGGADSDDLAVQRVAVLEVHAAVSTAVLQELRASAS